MQDKLKYGKFLQTRHSSSQDLKRNPVQNEEIDIEMTGE